MLSRVRTKLSDFAASMDAAATRLGHVAPNVVLWPLLYAVTIGSGVFVIRHLSWVASMDNNKVKQDDSIQMVSWVLAVLIALGVLYATAAPVARRLAIRRGAAPPTRGAVIAELHRRMRPLLALPLLPALTFPAIERDSPKETLFLIALTGVVAAASAYVWIRPLPRRRLRERAAQWAALLVVAVLWTRLCGGEERVIVDGLVGVVTNLVHHQPVSPAGWQAIRGALLFLAALVALAAATGVVAGSLVEAWLPAVPPLGATTEPPSAGDDPPPRRPVREGAARAAAGLSVAALWAGYGAFFSWLSITNHHALRTATIDLGIYDNIFYQSAHGRPLACSFVKAGYHGSAHFDPILVVLSPLYLLYPRAEFLLVLQSVWLGAGVVPVYLIARERLASRLAGVALAAMYAVYPALHGANMYEFHSLALIAPVALWLLYFLETGRYKSYWALLLPTLLVREDIAILLCFVGAYAVLARRPRWARIGWVTILTSMVYFVIVKRFFMTSADILMSGKDSYSFAYYYDDLIPNHNGVGGMLVSLLTNPVFVLKTVLAEPKLLYLATLFVPLCFLPVLARPGRVMLLWGMVFCLLASRAPVYSTHFQYSCIIIPAAFAITPAALRQIEDGPFVRAHGLDGARFWRALLSAAFVASLLTSWKFGGVIDNASFHGGFGPPARSLSDKDRETYAWIRQQVERIPLKDSVGLTNRTGAQAANRKGAFYYSEHPEADWLFIDETEFRGAELDRHNKAVQSGVFELVSKHDRFAVLRRKKPR